MSKKQQGLHPTKRRLQPTNHANQYISSPRQELFLDNYLDPASPTFSNIYRSALSAGYSDGHAREFAAPSNPKKWLLENPRLRNYQYEHITNKLTQLVEDDKIKASDKIKALELLSRLKGLLIEKKQSISVVKIELGSGNAPIEK